MIFPHVPSIDREQVLARLLRQTPEITEEERQALMDQATSQDPFGELYNFGSAAALSGAGMTSLAAEGLRYIGALDEHSVLPEVPPRTPELEEIPGTYEWGMENVGAEPYAPESLVGSFMDPATASMAGVAAIRALRPTRNLTKKPLPLGRMWDDVDDYDNALAMAKKGTHLKRDKNGQYIGAPRGVDTPQKLQKLRDKADQAVADGIYGSGWYDEARQTAQELSPDPTMQKLFARGTAAYSPQASPSVEVGHFAKQHNTKMLTGEDIAPRTKQQSWNVREAYTSDGIDPENIVLGDKTSPYANAKDPTIPDETLYKTANDIWHGRVMGYGDDFDRGFSPQEHGFLTGENLLLAERAGAKFGSVGHRFTPRTAQAATWVSTREKSYIAKKVAAAKKKGQEVDMAALTQQAKEFAASGIDPAVKRNSAYITSEARTGAGVKHAAMDDPQQIRDYTDRVQEISARDPILEDLGIYHKSAQATEGRYLNSLGEVETNPGFAHQTLVGTDIPKPGTKELPRTQASDQAALDYATHMGAVLRSQEAGAWSRFLPQNMGNQRVGDLNAVMLRHPSGQPDIPGMDLVNYSPESSMGVKFGEMGPETGNIKELQKLVPETVDYTRGRVESGYIDTGLTSEPGSGVATQRLLEAGENSPIANIEQRTAKSVAQQAAAMNVLDQEVAAKTGTKLRDDIMKMRDILSKGGVPALRKYVKENGAYGLPAVLLAILFRPDGSETNDALSLQEE